MALLHDRGQPLARLAPWCCAYATEDEPFAPERLDNTVRGPLGSTRVAPRRAARPHAMVTTPYAPAATTDGGYRRRIAAAYAVSLLVHGTIMLLFFFEVLGPGGGFGIGTGPGAGIGSGGGVGLGEPARQIFALSDVETKPERPTDDARLAMMLAPRLPLRPSVAPLERSTAKELAVLPLPAQPRGPALVENVRGELARAGSGVGGFGGGGGGGLGISFGRYVGELRRRGLDVVIVLDATGSMQNIIDETKQRMAQLVRSIQKLVPTARVGAVAFRDRPDGKASAPRTDEDFVVRWSDLTLNGPKVQAFLARVTAASGGDWEEAVREGIETAITELSWRSDAKKVMILVGSSPPHAGDQGPIAALAARFARMGGTISTIDVTERLHEEHERRMNRWLFGKEPTEISALPEFYQQVRESYEALADAGGGQMLTLDSQDELIRHLLVLTFGTEWRKEVARISRGM